MLGSKIAHLVTNVGEVHRRNGRLGGRAIRTGAAAFVVIALSLLATSLASATSTRPKDRSRSSSHPVLVTVKVTKYGAVLAKSNRRSLYVLSTERGTKAICKSGCLSIWPPLLVSSKVKSIAVAAGVKGKIGFVARSSTSKQVTFNGYPVFAYASDTGPAQIHGEGIKAFGGVWGLVRASATTASKTEIPPASKSTTTTTYGY